MNCWPMWSPNRFKGTPRLAECFTVFEAFRFIPLDYHIIYFIKGNIFCGITSVSLKDFWNWCFIAIPESRFAVAQRRWILNLIVIIVCDFRVRKSLLLREREHRRCIPQNSCRLIPSRYILSHGNTGVTRFLERHGFPEFLIIFDGWRWRCFVLVEKQ